MTPKKDEQSKESYEQVRERLRVKAARRIEEALDADEFNDVAKLSKDALAIFAKEDQTNGAREATRFLIAKSLTDDKNALSRYVAATTPEIQKALNPAK